MPPDITAGLMALAGPLPPTEPPGAASAGTAAAPLGSVSAALFASLLTQSSPPSAMNLAAAPKIAAALPVKLGLDATLSAKPLTSNLKTLSPLKTMDTLPALSFPLAGTAAKASELLLSSPMGHNARADDKTATGDKTATDASENLVDLTAATANVLNAVPGVVPIAVPVQAVLLPVHTAPLPVLTPAAAPTPAHASAIAAPSVSSMAAPSAAPDLFESAPSPAKVSLPPLPAPNALPARGGSTQPQSAPLTVSASLQPLPLILPQGLQAPVSQTPVSQTPQALAPQVLPLPAAVSQMAGQVAATQESVPVASVPEPAKTIGLPQVLPHTAALSPVILSREVPIHPLSLTQAAPLLLPSAPVQAVPSAEFPPALATCAPQAAVIQSEAAPLPLLPSPAKQPGKTTQITLKSPTANADTYTRIAAKSLQVEAPAVATKTMVSGSLPEPNLGSRSSAPEKTGNVKAEATPVETLEAGTPPTAQAAPPASGPSSRPLSAADQIKIVHQVADGVGAMLLPVRPDGVQQMSLQLHPKDWGSLQVSVSVTAGPQVGSAKTVTAHIVAETPQVKAALQSQTGVLHQALRASGLNLEHLTVSVKPAAETVKPASQSASAGFSGGQGPPPSGSRDAQPAQAPVSGPPAGMQLGTSAGSSQNGRQGQPPALTSSAASAAAQAEAEEIAPVQLPMRPVSGRIDTLA